jgi:hypothetical protein
MAPPALKVIRTMPYTRAPWEAVGHETESWGRQWYVDKAGGIPGHVARIYSQINGEEDARLIARAPTMDATLTRVRAALDGLKRQRDLTREGSTERLLLAGFCGVLEEALR